MTRNPSVVVHLKDIDVEVEVEDRVRSSIEKRCERMAEEFEEVGRFEITVAENGGSFAVNGHATGKNTDVATHAEASEPGPAADLVLDKIERQLRRVHDKRIFGRRRDARKDPPKRAPAD
jgi:ribosomal subunit interface protein